MIDLPETLDQPAFGGQANSDCPPPRGMTPRPGQAVCGDIDMRIDVNGTWFYHGSPIRRKELVNLFSTVVRRDLDGAYWMVTPAEMARIAVDDAPFVAVEMAARTDGGITKICFRTNVEKWVTLDADHPLRIATDAETGEPRPYIRLADDGTEALIARSVFYELVEHGVSRRENGVDIIGIESAGEFFPLGPVEAP